MWGWSIRKKVPGLYRWYKQRFNLSGSYKTNLWRLLTYYQTEYNKVSFRPCRGFKFMRLGGAYCGSMFCPVCWHRKQSHILATLARTRVRPYLWLKQIASTKWTQSLHPVCIRRFMGRSNYKLVCYSLNPSACSFKPTDEDIKADVFDGELSYELIGLFTSNKLIKSYGVRDGCGKQINIITKNEVVGVMDIKRVFNPTRAWLNILTYPPAYIQHELISAYIKRFATPPTGRSWAKVGVLK